MNKIELLELIGSDESSFVEFKIDDVDADTLHFARNPALVKFLQHFGYVEDLGLGVPHKIIRTMIKHWGKEPGLEEVGEEFMVTLYPATPE